MNKKINSSNKLAIKMVVALILGLAAGIGFIVLRENLMGNGNGHIWTSINNILFQDISQEGATSALGIFYIVGIVLLVYTYYRMFSKNISKMYAQNQKYLNAKYRAVVKKDAWKKQWQQRKIYRFYRCPGCKQKVRVPKGKGKICITCPKCRMEFIKKS